MPERKLEVWNGGWWGGGRQSEYGEPSFTDKGIFSINSLMSTLDSILSGVPDTFVV